MHPLIFDRGQFETLTARRGKITAIVPTSTAPLACLKMAVGSLLLRSDPACVESIHAVVNGPDERTGDPTLQAQKVAWLRRLRERRWHGRDMPLRITRTESGVGHAQALDAAIGWCNMHTEFFLSIHDDILITERDWARRVLAGFEDETVALLSPPPFVQGSLAARKITGRLQGAATDETFWMIGLPHLPTYFTACRTAAFFETGARWSGYHCEGRFRIEDPQALSARHSPHAEALPAAETEYRLISQDIGAWVKWQLEEARYRMAPLDPAPCVHFNAASWGRPEQLARELERRAPEIKELRRELAGSPHSDLFDDL